MSGHPFMSESDALGAIRAAFDVWEAANPRFRFPFLGLTDALPCRAYDDRTALSGRDGLNVVGFLPDYAAGRACVRASTGEDGSRRTVEADIALSWSSDWTWARCKQTDDSCRDRYDARRVDTPVGGGPIYGRPDLQGVVTHEIGHVIGLGHVYGSANGELTMTGGLEAVDDQATETDGDLNNDGEPDNGTAMSTLGLGDILGAKALYPWECPVVRPGQAYPERYRQLCPAIKVYWP